MITDGPVAHAGRKGDGDDRDAIASGQDRGHAPATGAGPEAGVGSQCRRQGAVRPAGRPPCWNAGQPRAPSRTPLSTGRSTPWRRRSNPPPLPRQLTMRARPACWNAAATCWPGCGRSADAFAVADRRTRPRRAVRAGRSADRPLPRDGGHDRHVAPHGAAVPANGDRAALFMRGAGGDPDRDRRPAEDADRRRRGAPRGERPRRRPGRIC